uniref:Uncharacterized protein n=1 Tax=uncultured marine microorganism HF4000_ANIW137K11 TaxID=455533 RepID=B3T4U7_9ZZZZ|nr:hypothetical protein ALOHA_HF4000ANIW137K11ctg4g7 [uncultured marine microorganism HF4000_ANIW137K11]
MRSAKPAIRLNSCRANPAGVTLMPFMPARLPDMQGMPLAACSGRPAHRHPAGVDFVRHSAGRIRVISRIAVISGLQSRTHLDRSKHAAHVHVPELALAAHHRQGIFRQRHVHLAHFRHAAFPHGHVVRQQLRDLVNQPFLLDAYHGRHLVPHGIHSMVAFVAVESPVSRRVGDKLHRAHLADGNIGGHLRPACCRRHPAAVSPRHGKLVAVQVDGMVGHAEVADADTHPLVQPSHHGGDTWKHAAVESPEIVLQHGRHLGRVTAGVDIIGVDEEDIVPVHAHEIGVFRVRDPEPHHAHGHLHHFVGVRMVHKGAGTLGLELIDKGLAGRDRRLREAAHAVHAVGQALPVPVDAGCLRQAIGDVDAHTIPLHHLDRRPRALAVVTPQMRLHAGRDLPHHGFRHQVELLDAIAHAPGQAPAIQGHHRVKRPAVARRAGHLGFCTAHAGNFRQGRHRHLADRARSYGSRSQPEKITAIQHHSPLPFSSRDATGPMVAIVSPASASQKSRTALIYRLTLLTCSRASASNSKALSSMPL